MRKLSHKITGNNSKKNNVYNKTALNSNINNIFISNNAVDFDSKISSIELRPEENFGKNLSLLNDLGDKALGPKIKEDSNKFNLDTYKFLQKSIIFHEE